MGKFYVYAHCFSDTKEIFYIGKGCGKRSETKGTARSKLWNSVVSGKEFFSMKIRDNLTENQAITLESELLQEFEPVGNALHRSYIVKPIDFNIINEIVEYDNKSPTFLRYKVDRANGAIKAGSVAGSFDSDGYGQVYITDKLYKIHRIIYCLKLGVDLDTNLIIDHIDRNKRNNNISNLRLVTHRDNAKNIDWSIVKPSNTGERGISERGNQYRVLWTLEGKQFEKSFNFGPRSKKTKLQVLAEAISFRNSLVSG